MAFTIPNESAASFPALAGVYQLDIDVLVAGHAGDGVASGCAVTAQGSPNMTLAVAAGSVVIAGTTVAVASGNVTVTANSSGNPRLDLVVVNNAGTKSVTAGTAASSPVPPAIPSDSVVLALVWVPDGDTAIASNQIVDKRVAASMNGFLINTQTGSYTLTIGDAGKVVEQNVATANNLTVPPNSSVAFPVGTEIFVVQYGAGATTIVAGSGVTLRALSGNLVLAGQYGWAKLVKRATDEWDVVVHGTIPGPRELARAVGPTTAQTGITTVTDIAQLSITFDVVNYPVDVELWPPFIYCSTGQVNAAVHIYDTPNSTIKQQQACSMYASGAYGPATPAVERITTPGSYTRKARIVRDTGTGTINVAITTIEAITRGVLRAIEVAT